MNYVHSNNNDYKLPSLNLLQGIKEPSSATVDSYFKRKLQNTFKLHGIEANIVRTVTGKGVIHLEIVTNSYDNFQKILNLKYNIKYDLDVEGIKIFTLILG